MSTHVNALTLTLTLGRMARPAWNIETAAHQPRLSARPWKCARQPFRSKTQTGHALPKLAAAMGRPVVHPYHAPCNYKVLGGNSSLGPNMPQIACSPLAFLPLVMVQVLIFDTLGSRTASAGTLIVISAHVLV